MSAVGWIIIILNIALAVDAGRRPASDWAAADRNKAFWVVLLALLGIVAFVPYVIGVLPRLAEAGRASRGSPFDKRSAGSFGKR